MPFPAVELMELQVQPVTRAPVETHPPSGAPAHATTTVPVMALQLTDRRPGLRTYVVKLTDPMELLQAREMGRRQLEPIALPKVDLLLESTFLCI